MEGTGDADGRALREQRKSAPGRKELDVLIELEIQITAPPQPNLPGPEVTAVFVPGDLGAASMVTRVIPFQILRDPQKARFSTDIQSVAWRCA